MRSVLPVLLALLLYPLLLPAQPPAFKINTGFVAPVSDIYRLILEDAFARLGRPVDFREVPAERAISLANDGQDDAECCRIWEINQTYTNLVPVPVELINIDFVAFTKGPDPDIRNWPDMAPYDVGVVHGWKILEVGLAELKPRRLLTLSTPQSMFSMLDKQRIQVATIDRLVGYKTAADLGLQGIQVHEPPLVSRPLYLQLHRKHQALVPELTHVLATMRAEGLLQRYYHQVVDPLEKQFKPSADSGGTP